MVWLPAEACRGMTKCQVVLTLPVLVPKLDTLVVSLRREAANIWMAAGAQKPHSGKGLVVPVENICLFSISFCLPISLG